MTATAASASPTRLSMSIGAAVFSLREISAHGPRWHRAELYAAKVPRRRHAHMLAALRPVQAARRIGGHVTTPHRTRDDAAQRYQSRILARSRATAWLWSWQMRDSLPSMTAAISLKLRSCS